MCLPVRLISPACMSFFWLHFRSPYSRFLLGCFASGYQQSIFYFLLQGEEILVSYGDAFWDIAVPQLLNDHAIYLSRAVGRYLQVPPRPAPAPALTFPGYPSHPRCCFLCTLDCVCCVLSAAYCALWIVTLEYPSRAEMFYAVCILGTVD